MIKDFLDRPLGASPKMELSIWQQRQAAYLYHVTSMDFLRRIHAQAVEFVDWVEALVAERRPVDPYMVSERWGVAHTTGNWAGHVFPTLVGYRDGLQRHIALRATEEYRMPDLQNVGGMMDNFSMQWTTPDQEKEFNSRWEEHDRYASHLYSALFRPNGLTDFLIAVKLDRLKPELGRMPRFRVRTDVVCESGRIPPRTGVYVPVDDPLGTLQFAWTGGGYGKLGRCVTYDETFRAVVRALGRDRVWSDEDGLLAYFTRGPGKGVLPEHDCVGRDGSVVPSLLSSAMDAHTERLRECQWYYVEQVNEAWESYDILSPLSPEQARLQSVPAGQACPRAGWWFTPAGTATRRRFEAGETMPVIQGSAYGDTFWQWSLQQDG